MTHYKVYNGEEFDADTSADVVHYLRATEWIKSADTDHAFMVSMAGRVLEQTGATVPTASPDAFVAGLVQAGLLKVEHRK